jgi:hypothetical protein
MRLIPDQDGMEFDTLDAAEREAVKAATEMGRDRLPKGDAREVTVEVKNEHHRRVLIVTVSIGIHRISSEPTKSRAIEYHSQARNAREMARWVSSEADQAQLLQKAEYWDAEAEAEELRMQDQDPSSAHGEGA